MPQQPQAPNSAGESAIREKTFYRSRRALQENAAMIFAGRIPVHSQTAYSCRSGRQDGEAAIVPVAKWDQIALSSKASLIVSLRNTGIESSCPSVLVADRTRWVSAAVSSDGKCGPRTVPIATALCGLS